MEKFRVRYGRAVLCILKPGADVMCKKTPGHSPKGPQSNQCSHSLPNPILSHTATGISRRSRAVTAAPQRRNVFEKHRGAPRSTWKPSQALLSAALLITTAFQKAAIIKAPSLSLENESRSLSGWHREEKPFPKVLCSPQELSPAEQGGSCGDAPVSTPRSGGWNQGKPASTRELRGKSQAFSWRSTEEPAHLLLRSHFSQGTPALAQQLF